MISTTTLFLFSILFFRFEDTAELTHNCKLACTATAAPLQGMIFKYQSWKVWFYDISLIDYQ